MEFKQILLYYIVFFAFVLTFCVLYIYKERLGENTQANVRLIDERIVLDKRFNYKDKYKELKSYGYDEKYKSPLHYLVVKCLFGLVGTFALYIVYPILGIVGFIAGFILFDFFAKKKNDSDNEKMSADIEMIYNVVSTQLKSGIYAGDALSGATDLITSERLKKAFREFSRHHRINDLTLKENLELLESKFCNDDISTLCMIINQAQDNGRAKDILHDLLEQIHGMDEMKYERAKAKTDIVMTLFMMILFSVNIAFVLYAFMSTVSLGLF